MRTLAVATIGAVLACGVVGRPAQACINAVQKVVDPKVVAVSRAEQLIDRGELLAAAATLVRQFPALRTAAPAGSGPQSRAQRLMAIVIARLDGAVTIRAPGDAAWRGETADERALSLEWAVTTLRRLAAARGYEPSIQTDLGEALAHVPKHHEEALHILSALAERDLLASAQAYAALARLRAAAGDAQGSDMAVKRCETLAPTPAACKVPRAS